MAFTLFTSCSVSKSDALKLAEYDNMKMELDELRMINKQNETSGISKIYTFLTFQDNNAENAMNFYVNLFDNSKIIEVIRWGKEGPLEEGKIMNASFKLNGSLYMVSDSPPVHEWNFSPAISNFVVCTSEKELDRLFTAFSEGGEVMMPLNNYGFSTKFGWVVDKYGVSWQLNLP